MGKKAEVPENEDKGLVVGEEGLKGANRYLKALQEQDFALLSGEEQAKRMGVSPVTISRWRKDVDWKAKTEEYRARYWYYSSHVDMAVVKKAMEGDLKAAELYYARFEGWDRNRGGMTVNVNLGKFEGMTNSELLAQLGVQTVEAQRVEAKVETE